MIKLPHIFRNIDGDCHSLTELLYCLKLKRQRKSKVEKMQHSTLTAPLILCGIFSIILQAVGFFSPAWMIFSYGIDTDKLNASSGIEIGASMNMGVDVQMGLWTTSACVDTGFGKTCASVSTTELEERISGNPGRIIFSFSSLFGSQHYKASSGFSSSNIYRTTNIASLLVTYRTTNITSLTNKSGP